MRRSRALVLFGWFLTTLAIATVSVRSQAANAAGTTLPHASSQGHRSLQLLPLQAKYDGLFGSFVKPEGAPDELPADEACSPDMVEVEGDYCPLVEQKCLRWLDPSSKLQCAEFAKTAAAKGCAMKTQHKHFCIDRYEWPNRAGVLPSYMASWYDAKGSCESRGKRLCGDTEWTLACEGPENEPTPTEVATSVTPPRATSISRISGRARNECMTPLRGGAAELRDAFNQREPSGSRASCVSPYGVRDMVGNVDEWVVNVSQAGQPHQSGLKGGYWGPVRTRCRPMTTAHDETFRYYQIGFRCCGEAHATEISDSPLAMR